MSDMHQPQYVIEGIIVRRIYEKRIEGYTIEMAKEISDAVTDEIADLKKANTLLHGFVTNRDAEIARLSAAKTAALKLADERAKEAVDLREEIASADRACQRLCGKHGYATGHGDSIANMIHEISAQIPLTDEERRCQKCGTPTRGEEADVEGQIWCHPCADAALTSAYRGKSDE